MYYHQFYITVNNIELVCYHQFYIIGSSQGSYSVRKNLTQDGKLDPQNRIKSTGNGKY